jgi:hypothetical protein
MNKKVIEVKRPGRGTDMVNWLDIKWNKVMVGKFFKVQR